MNAPEVVRRYATTLLETAVETEILEQIYADIGGVEATLSASAELQAFLADRLIDVQVTQRVLEQIFADKVSPLTANFLLLLAQRRRVHLLSDIIEAFAELYDERAGVVTAQVRSSYPLSQEHIEALRQRLSGYSGKQVNLQTEIDKSLKGGVIARIGDTVFDGSLDTYLTRLHRQLVGS
ncbi:MAG: ATP synthase F1 subunit delta [Candidatus Latescibacteria bacterium]|nr:ATP synthase F1 subunit delta [Candidatus Latescibacterota bacterium]